VNEIKNRIDVERSLAESCLKSFQEQNQSIFISSSFQTHSIPMLHMLSEMDSSIEVYFVDTGFHFPETLIFREQIVNLLDLNLKVVSSHIPKIDLITKSNRFLFTSNPDLCCQLNKVDPIDQVCKQYDIWISGVRKDQSSTRNNFDIIAKGRNGITRFHPMINWDMKMINTYIHMNNLPSHPLEKDGYHSIGCSPCTSKPVFDERSGRWIGMNKTECGLHLGVKKK